MELNHFLIKYKLKPIANFNNGIFEKNETGEDEEEVVLNILPTTEKITQQTKKLERNLTETEKDLINSKINILNQITFYFEQFDKIRGRMELSIGNEYFKNFLKLVKKNKSENLQALETPFLVLKQRCYYLKGKTALYCQHYAKSLNFFYKSESILFIGDAKIVLKSIKKILFILNMIKQNIIASIEKNPKNKQNGIKKENLDRIKKEINFWEIRLNFYGSNTRDILVLVNGMMKYEPKKFDQSIKLTFQIFKTLITSEDKFGMFLFGEYLNPVVQLSKITSLTYYYVKKEIKNLMSGMTNEFDDCTDINCKFKTSIFKALTYIRNKGIYN